MKRIIIEKLNKLIDNSDHAYHKLGCVVLDKRGNIISEGNNKYKTHPVQAKYASRNNKKDAIYLHAEISALVKCRREPFTLIVARKTKSGKWGLARPCPICMDAIRESGVKEIVYTDNDGKFISEKVN